MKLPVIYIISLFLMISCANNKVIIKQKEYVYKNDAQRQLILTFLNDSDCTLKDVYIYNNSRNELTMQCKYKILSNYAVVLINNDKKYIDTSGVGYFYFPHRQDIVLPDNSKQVFIMGPNYPSEYEKHAKVPFIDADTLINNRGKLHWIKKNKTNKVVGYFVFK